MIGEETYKRVGNNFDIRLLDRIRVKGKEQGVSVYELLGPIGSMSDIKAESMGLYEEAFTSYLDGRFNDAINMLEKVFEITEDKASQVLIFRCQEYIDSPPGDNWDGVYTMTTK